MPIKSAIVSGSRGSLLPLRDYYSRVLAYLTVAATVVTGTYVQHCPQEILWMVPYTLLYPQLAHLLSRPFHRRNPQRTDQALLLLDALHAGFAWCCLACRPSPR